MDETTARRQADADYTYEQELVRQAAASVAAERDAERQRAEAATDLLRQLAGRLDFIHADPAYISVWTINQVHVGPYQGPTYTALRSRKGSQGG